MTGTLSQLITLTSYGNEYLRNEDLAGGFYPNHNAFLHCRSVEFSAMISKGNEQFIEDSIAKTPTYWFAYLKKGYCKRIKMHYQVKENNDRQLAAFVGGGGTTLLETDYGEFSNFWFNKWEYVNEKWEVTYLSDLKQYKPIDSHYDIGDTHARLGDVLTRIRDFAQNNKQGHWAKIFDKALQALSETTPNMTERQASRILPKNYALLNKQLLLTASRSFVFGGMGSWNDVYFSDEEIYKQYGTLSGELYQTMMQAIVCSVNQDLFFK